MLTPDDATELTDSQRDALKLAFATLGEHFDACLIGVSASLEGHDGMTAEYFAYSGGNAAAIGLAVLAQNTVLNDTDESEQD